MAMNKIQFQTDCHYMNFRVYGCVCEMPIDLNISCAADKAACYPSMHSALKYETLQLHRELDSLPNLRILLQPALSMAEYCRILAAYAQVYSHVEQHLIQIEKTITLDTLPGYTPRLPSLCNDLRSLAVPVDLRQSETLSTSQLTRHQGMCHYIGLRYVLEGATQGSMFIAKRLEKNFPLLASKAFSFWNMQLEASRQWPQFCEFINQPAKCRVCERQMIQAAENTFRIFIECFSFPGRQHEKRAFW